MIAGRRQLRTRLIRRPDVRRPRQVNLVYAQAGEHLGSGGRAEACQQHAHTVRHRPHGRVQERSRGIYARKLSSTCFCSPVAVRKLKCVWTELKSKQSKEHKPSKQPRRNKPGEPIPPPAAQAQIESLSQRSCSRRMLSLGGYGLLLAHVPHHAAADAEEQTA